MTKPTLTPAEFQRLLVAVADLPFLHHPREPVDYVQDVLETVLNFYIQASVVVDALTYFRDVVQPQHGLLDHASLRAVLARFPDTEAGNRAASQFLWNNRHWTRLGLLRRLLTFLESIGATDQPTLRAWARQANYDADFKGKVKGLGLAVFHWLLIRCGVETIKPDVWVLAFAKRILGRPVSAKVLVETFGQIAPLVGETLPTIDVTIWHYEKLAMATADSPGLRRVAWHLLKAGFAAALAQEPQSGLGGTWTLVLDDPARLRDDPAGLTLTPAHAFFGDALPGVTTVTVQQSAWQEGLWLVLRLRHVPAVPPPWFDRLQQRLASSEGAWEAINAPVLDACLELEEDMRMSPALTLDELRDWVATVIAATLEGLALVRGTDGATQDQEGKECANALYDNAIC